MKTFQWLLILAAFIAAFFLFQFGDRIGPKEELDAQMDQELTQFSYADSLLQRIGQLSDADKDLLERFENENAFTEVDTFWMKQGYDLHSIHSLLSIANTTSNVAEQDSLLQIAMIRLKDRKGNQNEWNYLLDELIISLQVLVEKDEEKNFLQSRINLAECFINKDGQIMQGVLQLREVVQKDSLNLRANLLLGQLSMMSGQYDKAIMRLKTGLSVSPNNNELKYFLGEALLMTGKIEEGRAVFEEVKQAVNHPEFSEEVDKYILKILNQ